MLLITKLLANVLKVLNSEASPKQIAAGFAFGVWMGLLPLQGILPTLFFIVSFLININLGIVAVAAALSKLIALGLDPLSNQIGTALLVKATPLQPFWTILYNAPIVPYTKFNNTLVLGSFILGLFLLLPMYLVGKSGVKIYRSRFREKIVNSRIMHAFKASKIYQLYSTFQRVRGE